MCRAPRRAGEPPKLAAQGSTPWSGANFGRWLTVFKKVWYVKYKIDGIGYEAGPYSFDEVAFQRADIAGYDKITDVDIIDYTEYVP